MTQRQIICALIAVAMPLFAACSAEQNPPPPAQDLALPSRGDSYVVRDLRQPEEPPTAAAESTVVQDLRQPAPAANPPQQGDEARAAQDRADLSGGDQARPDPLEPVNEKVLKFNEKADQYLVHPVADSYSKVVPSEARQGLGRIFKNFAVVPRFANDVLQTRFKQAGTEVIRFGVNTTVGVGGLFDPADKWLGLKGEDNDFGLTLAKYGVAQGPYVMLPILGPSTVRDVIGMGVDGLMDPIDYVVPTSGVYYKYAAKALQAVNARAQNKGILSYIDLYTIDRYGAIQDAYLQHRGQEEQKVIKADALVHVRLNSSDGYDW